MSSPLDAMLRSTPQREPVEEGEDHEVEGTGQDERLPKVDRRRKEENRQDQALQEEDSEGAREEHEVSIAGSSERDHGDEGEGEREDGDGCKQDVLNGHHGNRRGPQRSTVLRFAAPPA